MVWLVVLTFDFLISFGWFWRLCMFVSCFCAGYSYSCNNYKIKMKSFYNSILCQAFSPCGNFLIVGDIYGSISVFHLSKVINPESSLTKQDQLPENSFIVQENVQINSLLSTNKHLIVGGFGEIYGYLWKSIKTSKDAKPSWKIELPNVKDSFDKAEVNCLSSNADSSRLYAGCGDNNIYVFALEDGKLVQTLTGHKDYIHCICNLCEQLVSGSEDGLVNIWDFREKKPVNKIEPSKNDKLARPELGVWIGAVNSNEDWLLCGGGPRLSLWHVRSLNNTTIFPIEDKGIHVAEFYRDTVLAGGRTSFFYKMNYNGDIVSEIPISSVSCYSAIHQEEPFKALCIAGSSPKIDVCTNFIYRDQVLSLY